jgi:ferredoxin-thioredoxin reductase catalytic subunit
MAVKLNDDPEVVASLKDALEQTGGYCPCVIEPGDDDKCMCKAFREKIADPEFEGFCHCGLYEKIKEDK